MVKTEDDEGWGLLLHEARRWYLTPQVLIAIAAFALACWGTLDSFADAGGNRIWGAMPAAAPALLTGWMSLSVLWMRNFSTQTLTARMLFAAFVGAVPVIIADMLFLVGAWMFPANRAMIANASFHYWWDGSIGTQLMITGLGGFVGQLGGVLLIILIVTLPVLSLRNPKVVATGSHLWKVSDGRRRDMLAAYLFCGLGSFMLGLILAIPTKGIDNPFSVVDELRYAAESLVIYRHVDIEQVVWLVGIGFLLGGAMLVAVACGEVLVARIRYALSDS